MYPRLCSLLMYRHRVNAPSSREMLGKGRLPMTRQVNQLSWKDTLMNAVGVSSPHQTLRGQVRFIVKSNATMRRRDACDGWDGYDATHLPMHLTRRTLDCTPHTNLQVPGASNLWVGRLRDFYTFTHTVGVGFFRESRSAL